MSSAFYPQGMNSWNNRTNQGGYKSWKGTGLYSNPIAISSGNIRPLTNKDPNNYYPTGFGLPRPLKIYRRGISIPNENNFPNTTREVKSSVLDYNVALTQDQPGRFIVKDNGENNNINDNKKISNDCKNCLGQGLISNWFPINNLTEKPQPNVTNPLLCCNQQRKAIQRVLPASTNVKKNYFQTTYMYLYNRCQTFEQREFNFINGINDPQTYYNTISENPNVNNQIIQNTKPGEPLSVFNNYVAQCNPNSTIEIGAKILILNELIKALYDKGIITESEYNQLKKEQIENIKNLLDSLDNIIPTKKNQAIIYLDELLLNPNISSILFGGPSNPKGCKRVYYKPNNAQYATQGAVSSSTRTLKLDVNTIEKNAYNQKQIIYANLATKLYSGEIPSFDNNKGYNNIDSNKCQPQTFTGNPFFFQGQHQNKNICKIKNFVPSKTYVSLYQKSAGNYIGSTQP